MIAAMCGRLRLLGALEVFPAAGITRIKMCAFGLPV
jgi:hypothetical protein